MKKVLSLILALVLSLSLCACGGTKGTELTSDNYDDNLELTLDNYDDYLELYASVSGSKSIETEKKYWLGFYSGGYQLVHSNFSKGYCGRLTSEVVAPNFNFQDVTVKVRFTGSVLAIVENSDHNNPTTQKCDFEFEDTFELTAGGTVKNNESTVFDLPAGLMMAGYISEDRDGIYSIDFEYEIIEIAGTVIPA